jgi:hypothetical protein
MIITKENFKQFSDTGIRLDISSTRERITRIDYLPKCLRVLHIGRQYLEELPELHEGITHFSCDSPTIKRVPVLPSTLHMGDLSRCDGLPKQLRRCISTSEGIEDYNNINKLIDFIDKID